jgi:Zn-dependent protease with chaperone function
MVSRATSASGRSDAVYLDYSVLITVGYLAGVSALALFAYAATRVKTIENSPGRPRAHDLRVLLWRMTLAGRACGWAAVAVCLWSTRWPAGSRGGAVLVAGAAIAFFCLPSAAARAPVRAAGRRVRGLPRRRVAWRRQWGLRALRTGLALAPFALALACASSLAARAAVLLAGYLVIAPVLAGLAAPVIVRAAAPGALPPDAGVRLRKLAAGMGLRVPCRVIRARSSRLALAGQLGWLPGLRYVLLTDYLLDQLPAPEVDAAVAHELAHCRHRDGLVRQLFGGVPAVLVALLGLGLIMRAERFLAVMCVVAVVAGLGSRRLRAAWELHAELAADDLAASVVGPLPVAAALTRLTEMHAIKYDTSPAWDRIVGHPSMAVRVARLRRAAGQVPAGGHAAAGPEK